jgi:hypothetical protein
MSYQVVVNLLCDYKLADDCAAMWEGNPGKRVALEATKKAAFQQGWRNVFEKTAEGPRIKLACAACVREIEREEVPAKRTRLIAAALAPGSGYPLTTITQCHTVSDGASGL